MVRTRRVGRNGSSLRPSRNDRRPLTCITAVLNVENACHQRRLARSMVCPDTCS
ncbi:hypothetical protein ACFFX0_31095 [Citricoccus parietis]|uniref:Uncharacterized protein n=1 Tax=Citricoccus parietis TaxID=592307 RepID=A0ABV5G8T5_9MICC